MITCSLCGATTSTPYCELCQLFWDRLQLVCELCEQAGLGEARAPELWQALGQVSYRWQIARNAMRITDVVTRWPSLTTQVTP